MTETSRFWTGISTGDAGPYSFEDMNEIFRYGLGGPGTFSGVYRGSGAGSFVGLQVTESSPAAASVLVHSGAALVHGSFYKSTSDETLVIAANSSGNPRIDSIVLTKLWAAQTVRLEVLQGTPAVSPVAPSLTQTDGFKWQFKLADIAVANGFATITNSNITDKSFTVLPRVSSGIFSGTQAAGDTSADIDAATTITLNIQSTVVKFTFTGYFRLITPESSFMYYNVYNDELGFFGGASDILAATNSFGTMAASGIFTGLTPGSQTFRLRHRCTSGFTGSTYRAILVLEEIRD